MNAGISGGEGMKSNNQQMIEVQARSGYVNNPRIEDLCRWRQHDAPYHPMAAQMEVNNGLEWIPNNPLKRGSDARPIKIS